MPGGNQNGVVVAMGEKVGAVHSLLRDRQGNLWIGAEEGLALRRGCRHNAAPNLLTAVHEADGAFQRIITTSLMSSPR